MSQFSLPIWAQIAESLTSALLHFIWQGALLPLILVSTMKILGVKAVRVRYLLSVGTLVAMGFAPLLTMALHQDAATPVVASSNSFSLVMNAQGPTASDIDSQWRQAADVFRRPDVEVVILMAWLAGVLFLSARLAMGFGVTLWIRANIQPLSGPFEQLARKLGERLQVHAADRVYASARIGQAIAVGWLRPVVLLPASWLMELPPAALEAVIAHELAHIRRWDLWVNLLQRVVETLLFYHPAVWWLSQRIRREREMCCDELATSCLDRAEYARSLESVARMSRGNLLMATSFQGERQMELLNRIRHLLGAGPVATESNWWAAGFVAISLPLLAVVAISVISESAATVAMAEDDQNAAAKNGILIFNAGIGNGIALEAAPEKTDQVDVKVGDRVGMKISGELFKEFVHVFAPNKSVDEFKPSEEFFIGTIEALLSDGRCRINYANGVDRGDKVPQLFTMTAIVERSQIKMPPPLTKNQKIVVMRDGKATTADLVVGKKYEPTKHPLPDKPAVTTVYVDEIKQDYYYLELSDLKGVKFKLWELKREVGE